MTMTTCNSCGGRVEPGELYQRCSNLVGNNQKTALKQRPKIEWRVGQRPPKGRSPHCHVYNRVSTSKQAEEGVSLEGQDGACMAYVESLNLGPEFLFERYVDDGVSAFKKHIIDRPEGSRMARNLWSGDIVCIWSIDRAFRSMLDFARTYHAWHSMGIRLAVVQIGINAAPGSERAVYERFQLNLLASVAEMESAIKSDRAKLAIEAKRRNGEWYGFAPAGFRPVLKVDKRVITPSRTLIAGTPENEWVEAIYHYRRIGLPWPDLMERLELWHAYREDRGPKAKFDTERKWTIGGARTRFAAYCNYLKDGERPNPGLTEAGKRMQRHTRD